MEGLQGQGVLDWRPEEKVYLDGIKREHQALPWMRVAVGTTGRAVCGVCGECGGCAGCAGGVGCAGGAGCADRVGCPWCEGGVQGGHKAILLTTPAADCADCAGCVRPLLGDVTMVPRIGLRFR